MTAWSDPVPVSHLKAGIVILDSFSVQTGSVSGADSQRLRVDTAISYAKGERVLVRIGAYSVHSEVAYSIRRGDGFRTGINLRAPRVGHRKERCVPFHSRACVTPIDGNRGQAFEAEITDLSSSGLGLRAGQELCPGDTIAVETASCIAFGEVMRCYRKADGCFHVGVRVTELLGSAPVPRRLDLSA